MGKLKAIGSKMPHAFILYLLFKQKGRASEPSPESLATLTDKSQITISNPPQDKKQYINLILKKVQKSTDWKNPAVKAFAANLAGRYEGQYKLSQVAAIHQHITSNFRYVNDPNSLDYFEKASSVIVSNLAGDCDSVTSLLYSLVKAIGGTPRYNVAFSKHGGHAFAEVLIGKNKTQANKNIQNMLYEWRTNFRNIFETFWRYVTQQNFSLNTTKDSDEKVWLNLDYSSNFPGGPYFDSFLRVALYPDKDTYTVIKGNL